MNVKEQAHYANLAHYKMWQKAGQVPFADGQSRHAYRVARFVGLHALYLNRKLYNEYRHRQPLYPGEIRRDW